MAIIKSVLISGAKGSLGNITLTTHKGRVVAKEKATIVKNPKTAKQTEQRKALSNAVFAWKKVGHLIKSGYTVTSKYGNPYSEFIRQNIEHYKGSEFDQEHFKNRMLEGGGKTNTKGKPLFIDIVDFASGTLNIGFSKTSMQGNTKDNDKIVLLYGDADGTEMYRSEVLVKNLESSGSRKLAHFTLKDNFTASEIIMGAWLESADGKFTTYSDFFVNTINIL